MPSGFAPLAAHVACAPRRIAHGGASSLLRLAQPIASRWLHRQRAGRMGPARVRSFGLQKWSPWPMTPARAFITPLQPSPTLRVAPAFR